MVESSHKTTAVSPLMALQPVSRMPELKDIPTDVLKDCQRLERDMESDRRLLQQTFGVTSFAVVAALASRYTHHQATGRWDWGKSFDLHQLDWKTISLTAVSMLALGGSLAMGAGNSGAAAAYKAKCQDYYWAKIGEGETAVTRYFKDNEFTMIEPVAQASSHWYDGAERFARNHVVITVGVAAVGIVAYGAAIYFTGGAAAIPLAL